MYLPPLPTTACDVESQRGWPVGAVFTDQNETLPVFIPAVLDILPTCVSSLRPNPPSPHNATLESDPKTGALFLATPEGDCYPAVVSANGDYQIQVGAEGRSAIVTETLDGYHLQTDEGKEFLLHRLTWAGDYLPLVLVGAFALWIDVAYCIQAAENLVLQKFPVEGFQIAGLLTFLFGCSFFRAARLIIRRKQCPPATMLVISSIITGAVLGWFGTQEVSSCIISALLGGCIYVGAGSVLRRMQQWAFDR